MLVLLALAAAANSPEADQPSRMTNLYKRVCLKAFPDDKAVESLMMTQKARPLTPEEVKVTMRDDPARGWELQDGSSTVWIEFPPYHACSVRWNSPEMGDFSEYWTIAQDYEKRIGGFAALDPYNADFGDIHVHAVGEQRALPNGGQETLFIFDQHITDPARQAKGDTGYVLRFVHQYHLPDSK